MLVTMVRGSLKIVMMSCALVLTMSCSESSSGISKDGGFITPSNNLENCLVNSAIKRSLRDDLDDVVANSEIFVRVRSLPKSIDRNKVEPIDYYSVYIPEYGTSIAVFSSKKLLYEALGDGPYIAMYGRDIFKSSGGISIVLNYGLLPSVMWSESGKGRVINSSKISKLTC